jgi:protein-tyrosine phosphatase
MSYENYNWIDENIAVGNNKSDYQPFNIIINLDYNNNGVEYHSIDMNCINGKHIYKIGCYDSETENMIDLIKVIIPDLVKFYIINPSIKILFHCAAGISRSSTMAISFLCMAKNYPLWRAYNLVSEKRPVIRPNRGFMNCLIQLFQ